MLHRWPASWPCAESSGYPTTQRTTAMLANAILHCYTAMHSTKCVSNPSTSFIDNYYVVDLQNVK